MAALDDLREAIPEAARDLKLNLQSVLSSEGALSPAQRWGVAVASAVASRNGRLRAAVLADARAQVEPAVVEDGVAAAALMGMNNVYYRFRHLIGRSNYADKPARLRMNRIAKPAGSKVDFELFCLAVSAINGCATCLQAHENVVLNGGLTDEHVHDAVRIAGAIHGAAVALDVTEPT
jgi:alkyl hydroperoxide reductase subunit D